MQKSFGNPGLRAVLAICSALMMLSTVTPLEPVDEVAAATTSLRIGMIEPIDSLNPFIGINDNAYIFYALIYDYLIAVDENMQPKPNLAESWYIVPDLLPVGSVWQYNLTKNAFWHDGEPFTAADVKFTMDYQSGLNWSTMWAYQPYTILINYTEVMGENTVRMHFKDFGGMPAACSFGTNLMMPIVPKHIWEDINVQQASFAYPNKKPIGTGPFMCTESTYDEFLNGNRFILLKNPQYHLGPVEFDRLVIEFYLEPAAMVVDMRRGAIDTGSFSAPNYKTLIDRLKSDPDEAIGTSSELICNSYSVAIDVCMLENAYNGLRRDPAVRKAMALMTNKTFIKEHIYKNFATEGYSIMSPVYGDLYWEPEASEIIPYNEAMANQVLSDAGYVWDGDVRVAGPGNTYGLVGTALEFDALVETELFEDRATSTYLQGEWAKIGIKLNPQLVDSAIWNTLVYDGAYDLAFTYWSGDPDPNYLLFIQSTYAHNGWSENWFSSPEYDYNYTMSILTVDPELRAMFVKNCEKIMYEECCYIVTAYPYGCYAWRNDHFSGWGNWTAHPGRQISNYWSANDLWFNLVPISTNEAPVPFLDNAAGHLGDIVEVTGWAYDFEGDPITYLLEFGDETNTTGALDQGERFSVSHEYAAVGNYTMQLTVYDDGGGQSSEAIATIVPVGWNCPPSNVHVMTSPYMNIETGTNIEFTLGAKDVDGDAVVINLDFGDNSPHFEETRTTETTSIFQMTTDHAYEETGIYTIIVSASDAQNTTTVAVEIPIIEGGGSNTMMIIVIVVIIAVVAVAVGLMLVRKRKGPKKEEGDVQLPIG